MAFEVRGKSAATPVEDSESLNDPTRPYSTLKDSNAPLTDLQRHDSRFHPKGYKEGDACKYRETLAKTDNADDLSAAERDEHKAKYGNLSVRKRDEYYRLMSKKHPELDAETILFEIGKIADSKVQKDAFAWLMRGAVRLPEDLYKVEQARELAGKAKKDPLSYDTPQACINDLLGHGHKVSLKPITVEELKKDPLFSDYKKLPYGIETFEVEDSKEGQMRMREVLDTHWGKDANPWCLLARQPFTDAESHRQELLQWWYDDGKESVGWEGDERPDDEDLLKLYNEHSGLGGAWNYWNHYNALPKRVAFKDGKLLAFMATHAMDEDEAFDDAAYSAASKLAEMYPDEFAEYEEWEDTDEGREEGANFFEWLWHNYPELACNEGLREHTSEEWWDRQDSPHHGIPVGNVPVEDDPFGRWADIEIRDGKAMPLKASRYTMDHGKPVYPTDWHRGEPGTDGYVAWHENGQKSEEVKDGKTQKYHPNGMPDLITFDDISAKFYDDGRMYEVKNFGKNSVKNPTWVTLDKNGDIQSMRLRWEKPASYGMSVPHQDGYIRNSNGSNELTTGSEKPIGELESAASKVLAEARRCFTPDLVASRRLPPPSRTGSSRPAPSTDGRAALDQFPAFNPASFAAYLAKN